jgi:hypothetical protein
VTACEEEDLVAALDDALRAPYHDYTFSPRTETRALGDKTVHVWIQTAYRSQRRATAQMDLGWPVGTDTETERLPGIPLSTFGLTDPADAVCLSLRFYGAQEFHGNTKVPHHAGENDRFRDAVDLSLLRDLVSDDGLRDVREAWQETCRIRKGQARPRAIVMPPSRREPYGAMACTVGLDEADLESAEGALREFLAEIEAA